MSTPVGPYSPIVRSGDLLFTSGQIGMDDGSLVRGGFRNQFAQAMQNLGAVLASEGAAIEDIVKTTVFLRHMSDYPLLNELYVDAFAGHRPARSAVGVAELPLGALVEIEAIARAAA